MTDETGTARMARRGPDRRQVIAMAMGVAAAGAAGWPARAVALAPEEATEFVQGTIDEVLALVRGPGSDKEKAREFRTILEKRAAMPQIARAAAGRVWREMSDAQQERYSDAFIDYVSRIYSARFDSYSGEQVEVRRALDRGNRGVLVSSEVVGGENGPVAVDWLVSDRPGRTVIADIVIEGVSMVITQRDEIGGLYERNGRDPEKLIDALRGA